MPSGARRTEDGTAVVDFVLVMVLLVPLVLGIVQLALVMYVRNTVALAASEGARAAAAWESSPASGLGLAREQWSGTVAERFIAGSRVETVEIAGAPAYRVVVDVAVPALGLGGPAVTFEASGTAVIELDPVSPGPVGTAP